MLLRRWKWVFGFVVHHKQWPAAATSYIFPAPAIQRWIYIATWQESPSSILNPLQVAVGFTAVCFFFPRPSVWLAYCGRELLWAVRHLGLLYHGVPVPWGSVPVRPSLTHCHRELDWTRAICCAWGQGEGGAGDRGVPLSCHTSD